MTQSLLSLLTILCCVVFYMAGTAHGRWIELRQIVRVEAAAWDTKLYLTSRRPVLHKVQDVTGDGYLPLGIVEANIQEAYEKHHWKFRRQREALGM